MAKYSKNDIIRIVDEEDIEFIRLQFTDIFGTLKNVAITASQLEKALDNKCMFDGSSIEGFVRIEESDMYLHPDLDTFMIFPWRPQQGKVARIICDVYMADGTPFEGDPRYILKKQIEKAKQMGYIFNVGPECEFFLFHLDENGQRIPDGKGGWKNHREDTTDWNDKENVEIWRAAWAAYTNRALESAGRPERIDHRSYKRQGIDKIPSVHLGPAASQMEKPR